MERNLIFCFSGTGNSLKAAKDVAEVLSNTEIVLMKDSYKLSDKYNRIGFVFPSYAGGVPKAVVAYINALEIAANATDYFFTVVTCGGAARNTLPMLRDTLAKKGISLNWGKELNTVGNYIAMYAPKPGIKEKLQSANEKIAVYAGEIKDKKTANIGKSKLNAAIFYKMGNLFFKMNAKQLTVSDSCTSCGTCEKLCPTNSIKIENKKPLFTWKTCSQCMACIQWCPPAAINCGKKTGNRARYHNPAVTADELV